VDERGRCARHLHDHAQRLGRSRRLRGVQLGRGGLPDRGGDRGASAGRVAEAFGLGRASSFAGIVFAVGCALSAAAPDMHSFLAGRVVQGVGSGWFSGFAMVAIAQLFPERQLARVFAIISGVWGVATLLGPLVGGLFAEAGNWRAVFWIFLVQAVIFAALAPFLFREAKAQSMGRAIPVAQLLLVTLGISAIALADLTGSQGRSLALILGGFLILTLVFAVDARVKVRLLPHRAGDPRTVIGAGYLSIFAISAASMPFSIYVPPVLQQLKGLTALQAGYVVAALALVWTLAAFVVSNVVSGKERPWIRWGGLLIALGTVLQHFAVPTLSILAICLAGMVMGCGFGLCTSLTNRLLLRTLTQEDQAIGSAALMSVRQVGGAVGAALAGVAANMAGFSAGLTDASARGVAGSVFLAVFPLAAVGAAAVFAMTRRRG